MSKKFVEKNLQPTMAWGSFVYILPEGHTENDVQSEGYFDFDPEVTRVFDSASPSSSIGVAQNQKLLLVLGVKNSPYVDGGEVVVEENENRILKGSFTDLVKLY